MRNIRLLRGLVVFLGGAVLVMAFLLVWETTGGKNSDGGQTPDGDVHADPRVVARIGSTEYRLDVLQEQLLERYGAELINELLNHEAMRLEAEESGIKITRDDVDAELKRMQQGYDSEEQFYESMETQIGMSKEDIREDVYYKLIFEAITTRSVEVTDQEVNDYIREHPEEFKASTMLRIEKIVCLTTEQAERTIQLYDSGRDFSELAKERSIDEATASDGGDLGWVEDDDPFISQEILQAAKGLSIGSISGPIKTEEGYEVIRLKDRREQTKGSPEEIRQSVHKMLALQKAPPMQDTVKELRKKFGAAIMDPAFNL